MEGISKKESDPLLTNETIPPLVQILREKPVKYNFSSWYQGNFPESYGSYWSFISIIFFLILLIGTPIIMTFNVYLHFEGTQKLLMTILYALLVFFGIFGKYATPDYWFYRYQGRKYFIIHTLVYWFIFQIIAILSISIGEKNWIMSSICFGQSTALFFWYGVSSSNIEKARQRLKILELSELNLIVEEII